MIQYYSVKHKHKSGSQDLKVERPQKETISKQLEYVTIGRITMQTILF